MHADVGSWQTRPWRAAPLVAIDLEGTGAQDGPDEAILEIAAVPLLGGVPDTATAYTTLVNPGRHVPAHHWISPGLTNNLLATAPQLTIVEPDLADRLNGKILVGHNIGVDWRLLHRRCPSVTPAALVDTYKLSRQLTTGTGRSLTVLLHALDLTAQVSAATPGSQPHRALWDTVGAGLLLGALIGQRWPHEPMLAELLVVASCPLEPTAGDVRPSNQASDELTLF